MVTDNQILDAIKELSKRGYAPSVREVGEAVGFRSTATTYYRLSKLRERGAIEWEPTQVRTLRVLDNV
ncbi:hypothetical protein JCM14036_03380 [Desulfotomaculum defluvii]